MASLPVRDLRWRFHLVALAGGLPLAALVAGSAAWPAAFAAIGPLDRWWLAVACLAFALWIANTFATRVSGSMQALGDDAAALAARDRTLTTERDQLRAIADSVPGQIVYIDTDERYRYVNAYRSHTPDRIGDEILGRTVREVRGDRIYALASPDLHRALQGETRTFEALSPTPGPDHWFRTALVPVRDRDGRVAGVISFSQDTTERKTAELRRDLSEKRLVTITDNLPAMVCYVDGERRFQFANRAVEKWLELPLADIVGREFDALIAPELAADFGAHFERGMRGDILEHEFEVGVRRGGPRWLRCAFIPDVDASSGVVRGVYGMIHDVTKAKHAELHLSRLARYDALTGLANRHRFDELFEVALAANDREPKPLALMFLDIDHFKQVNDRHGHGGGDILLSEFGRRLKDCVDPNRAVARLSGDEFVILLEGMHSEDEPQFIARKIIAAVDKPFLLGEQRVEVTTSIGIAMRLRLGEPASQLLRRADDALYEAKRGGRNTFRMAG